MQKILRTKTNQTMFRNSQHGRPFTFIRDAFSVTWNEPRKDFLKARKKKRSWLITSMNKNEENKRNIPPVQTLCAPPVMKALVVATVHNRTLIKSLFSFLIFKKIFLNLVLTCASTHVVYETYCQSTTVILVSLSFSFSFNLLGSCF